LREADGIHFRAFGAPVLMAPFLVQKFSTMLRGAVVEHHAPVELR
jgi:hypothetical protein